MLPREKNYLQTQEGKNHPVVTACMTVVSVNFVHGEARMHYLCCQKSARAKRHMTSIILNPIFPCQRISDDSSKHFKYETSLNLSYNLKNKTEMTDSLKSQFPSNGTKLLY